MSGAKHLYLYYSTKPGTTDRIPKCSEIHFRAVVKQLNEFCYYACYRDRFWNARSKEKLSIMRPNFIVKLSQLINILIIHDLGAWWARKVYWQVVWLSTSRAHFYDTSTILEVWEILYLENPQTFILYIFWTTILFSAPVVPVWSSKLMAIHVAILIVYANCKDFILVLWTSIGIKCR